MTKRQLIDEIRQINTSAQVEFLSQFQEPDLQQYLEHLQDALRRRVHIASWVRKTQKYRMVS